MVMDERQPLLEASEERRDALNSVGLDLSQDPDSPKLWPTAYKWGIVALLASMGFVVTFTCTSIAPIANHVIRDLDGDNPSKSASVLLVTIWELGEAAGPLFLAPLSEAFGRYPVVNAANVLFISAVVLAALCQSAPLLIAARALTGLAVASNVLNPVIVGDIMVPEERGFAMSLVMMAPLLGGAIGPTVGTVVTEALGWRSVLWVSVALASICEVMFLAYLRETCNKVILQRKAAKLKSELGKASPAEALLLREHNNGLGFTRESALRPVVIFCDSGVLMILCLFSGVGFSLFYVLNVTLPDILEVVYEQPLAMQGPAFLSFTLGLGFGIFFCNRTLDRVSIKLRDSNGGVAQPEFRLPLAVIGALLLPASTMFYGCAPYLRLPLPLLLLSVTFLGTTVLLSTLPVLAYVVDAFGCYAASAVTGLIFVRSLAATFLPLSAGPLIERFGYGGGFAMLSAVCLCIAPIPILVMRFGSAWRQRSTYSRDD